MYGVVITEKGFALDAKLRAGEQLKLTRVMVGDGTVPEDTNPRKLTDLVSPFAQATSTTPVAVGSSTSLVVEYRNDMNGGLDRDRYISEFGVFAQDPEEGEILYLYGDLGDFREPVRAYSPDTPVLTRRYPVTIIVSDGVEVALGYLPSVFMTEAEARAILNAHNVNAEAHQDIREAISGLSSSLDEKMEAAKEELDGKVAQAAKPHYITFEPEDWDGNELRVAPEVHGLEPVSTACVCSVRQLVGRNIRELTEDDVDDVAQAIIDATKEALDANKAADAPPEPHTEVSVCGQSWETELGDKLASDLVSEDTAVGMDGSVTGTLKYVTGWSEFSPDDGNEQSGYFLPLRLDEKYAGKSITVQRDGGQETTSEKLDWILRVPNKDTVWTIQCEGEEVVRLTFAWAALGEGASKYPYPPTKDGHIPFTWEQVQYWLLEDILVSDSRAESLAEALGFGAWKERDNGVEPSATLDALLTTAYTPAMNGPDTIFKELCTLEALQGLRFRLETGGSGYVAVDDQGYASVNGHGFAAKYDMDGVMKATWGTMATQIFMDLDTKELVLQAKGPYAGDVQVIG